MGLLTVVACNSAGRRAAMTAILDRADSLNRNYIPITTDSLLREAADYFDSHGTPNERLRAHYLLGCAYRDMGEAPRAIEAWQDAIACADTTATDCDYALMSKVCSQMAEAFYQQNLVVEDLKCLDQAIYYAYHAQDTLAAMISYAYKMSAYDRIGLPDSVEIICDRYYSQMSLMGYERLASQNACMGVNALLTMNKVNKAKFYLDSYEAHSGFFDEAHNIVSGREAYYNLKGRYFQAIHQYDSAKYYYLKELQYGSDYMNQNMASLGLAQVFQALHCPDSAAKYALYSYEMNDSVYAQMSTEEVEKTKNLYNYTRNQRIAIQEKEKAEKAHRQVGLLICLLIVLSLVVVLVFYIIRKKRREEKEKFLQLVNKLEKTQTDILLLKTENTELDEKIKEKETAAEKLKQELAAYQQNIGNEKDDSELRLANSQAYLMLTKKVSSGGRLSDEEWSDIHKLVIEVLPRFYSFISAKEHELIPKEYYTCILLRLHVPPVIVSNFLEVHPSYVTKLSKQILWKLFNKEGTSKDLSKLLSDIC